MPKTWAIRFGRTVAEQALGAIENRMQGPARPGMTVNLAREETLLHDLYETNPGNDAHTVPHADLLLRSDFSLTAKGTRTNRYAFWGQGAVSSFDGRESGLSLVGEVATALIGADWSRNQVTAGLIIGHSLGNGTYQGHSDGNTIKATLTGLRPWSRYAISRRVALWGAAGYGAGTLTLTQAGSSPLKTDLDLLMGAIGLRGELLQAPDTGGLQLALKTDAMTLRTTTAKTTGLAASDARITRLRLGLEGSWPLRFGAGGTLTPSLEIGIRHDAGDAETGFGTDLGIGLIWSNPGRGLAAEFRARGMLTHEAQGFQKNGFSAGLSFDPTPDSDRGLTLALTQTIGASAAGGVDQLFRQENLAGLATDEARLASQRLEMRLGYGMAAFGGRWTATPEAAVALLSAAREYSVGWRLGLPPKPSTGRLEFRLEASRREATQEGGQNAPPVHAAFIRLMSGW